MRNKISFEDKTYTYGSLNRFEANDFVEAVVASAFPTIEDENGKKSMDYDPLSKLMAIKVNIIKFYGDVDFKEISVDELYKLACDIDIEGFKQYDINVVQFEDMLKAIDEKCDYIKQQMIVAGGNGLDELFDLVAQLAPIVEMANEVMGDTDPEITNSLMKMLAENGMELTPEDVVEATVNSENFQKNRENAIDAIKQGAADAVNNKVVSIDDRK